jgi:hypothetical protein
MYRLQKFKPENNKAGNVPKITPITLNSPIQTLPKIIINTHNISSERNIKNVFKSNGNDKKFKKLLKILFEYILSSPIGGVSGKLL